MAIDENGICDCCDVDLIPIYSKKGVMKDLKCSHRGKLLSENIKTVVCSVDGFLLPVKGGK
jgi:hypothetical protein